MSRVQVLSLIFIVLVILLLCQFLYAEHPHAKVSPRMNHGATFNFTSPALERDKIDDDDPVWDEDMDEDDGNKDEKEDKDKDRNAKNDSRLRYHSQKYRQTQRAPQAGYGRAYRCFQSHRRDLSEYYRYRRQHQYKPGVGHSIIAGYKKPQDQPKPPAQYQR